MAEYLIRTINVITVGAFRIWPRLRRSRSSSMEKFYSPEGSCKEQPDRAFCLSNTVVDFDQIADAMRWAKGFASGRSRSQPLCCFLSLVLFLRLRHSLPSRGCLLVWVTT